MHWSAGAGLANPTDRAAYHLLVEMDGKVIPGLHNPEANLSTATPYAAHTGGLNTGSIGIALCGMRGANESPFRPGSDPIRQVQVDAMVQEVAALCRTYRIPVTRRTVLTHAEVERTLGVKQRPRWDISWLPDMDGPGDAIEVGDRLRAMVSAALTPAAPAPAVSNAPWWQGIVEKVMAWLLSK